MILPPRQYLHICSRISYGSLRMVDLSWVFFLAKSLSTPGVVLGASGWYHLCWSEYLQVRRDLPAGLHNLEN